MFELGRSVTHTVGGKKYVFSRLKRWIVLAFRDWIKEQIGDPFAVAARFQDHLPDETVKQMVKDGEKIKEQFESFSIGCPLSQRFLATEIGLGQLAYFMLQEMHPDITEDQAFDVVTELGLAAVAATVQKAAGEPPGKNTSAPAA
jgi:hypothetical protein